jgi:hypothetical protein
MLGQYVAAGSSWSYDLLKLKVYECIKLTWAEYSHTLKVYEWTKLTWAEHSHTLNVYECTKLTWAEHSHILKVCKCTKLTWVEHSHTLPNNWPSALYHHPNCSTAKNLYYQNTCTKKLGVWHIQGFHLGTMFICMWTTATFMPVVSLITGKLRAF